MLPESMLQLHGSTMEMPTGRVGVVGGPLNNCVTNPFASAMQLSLRMRVTVLWPLKFYLVGRLSSVCVYVSTFLCVYVFMCLFMCLCVHVCV